MPTVEVSAEVRAYREGRHGSRKWANRAAFSDATDLYQFRVIPNLEIKTDMLIYDGDSILKSLQLKISKEKHVC